MLLIVAWQIQEHLRLREANRSAVILRARDISNTLGVVIRSQRMFWGIIPQRRLESALKELAESEELISVALLNATGNVVCSEGPEIDFDKTAVLENGEYLGENTVTVFNLIDLGSSISSETESERPAIVLPEPSNDEVRRRPFSRDSDADEDRPPPPGEDTDRTNRSRERGERWDGPPRSEQRGRFFPRPFWMSKQEYEDILAKQGLHGIALVLSTDQYNNSTIQDLWLRFIICIFATAAMAGLGLAWRNLVRSSELQVRLTRASDLNNHLREMNLAAAGLAHETRNPLNIIRGMAQMISRDSNVSEEIQQRSKEISTEVDHVTSQLNEFINYSKPREVRRSPINLNQIIDDVTRTLGGDLDDKSIDLKMQREPLTIEADESMLRQVLFNLLINSIQSAKTGGAIRVKTYSESGSKAVLEISDDGPGVPVENREDIFRPYFTTNQNGTGLGLAITKQIILAHGWDIDYIPTENSGACFRINHIKTVAKS